MTVVVLIFSLALLAFFSSYLVFRFVLFSNLDDDKIIPSLATKTKIEKKNKNEESWPKLLILLHMYLYFAYIHKKKFIANKLGFQKDKTRKTKWNEMKCIISILLWPKQFGNCSFHSRRRCCCWICTEFFFFTTQKKINHRHQWSSN